MGASNSVPQGLRELNERFDSLDRKLDSLDHQIDNLVNVNSLLVNPLNSFVDLSQRFVEENEPILFCERYEYDREICMLSSEKSPSTSLARILPFSSVEIPPVVNLLELTSELLNDDGNHLLLAENIKANFDLLNLSFEASPGREGLIVQYKLRIWNPSTKAELISENSTHTIGEFEGQSLGFKNGHKVCERFLAFQGLWAAANAKENSWLDPSKPFGYRFTGTSDVHQRQFLALLHLLT